MAEYFILMRDDTKQYYHSILPNGNVTWVDEGTNAYYLTQDEVDNIMPILARYEIIIKVAA